MNKRIIGMVVLALALALGTGLFAATGDGDDYKVIKNAVQAPTAAKAGLGTVQWLKILVTPRSKDGENVKVTLPVSLVEIMLQSCPDKKFRVHDNDCEIDIRLVWNELKAAGPRALIEVENHDEIVKIWFE